MTVAELIAQLEKISNKDVQVSITNMSNSFCEYEFEVKSFVADENWVEIVMDNFIGGNE